MENNIQNLIERIENSNLSDADKNILLEKLNKKEPDIPGFVTASIAIFKVAKVTLKLFDIDIWDDF